MGIIIISDDIPEVISSCNRLLIMKKGKVSDGVNTREITERELAEKKLLWTIDVE